MMTQIGRERSLETTIALALFLGTRDARSEFYIGHGIDAGGTESDGVFRTGLYVQVLVDM